MPQEAPAMLGLPWAYVGLLVAGLLIGSTLALLLFARSRRCRSAVLGLIVCAALCAAMWTTMTVGRPIIVPIPEDPDGAVCLLNPHGENPNLDVNWKSECGQAFSRHLVITIGPSAVMLVVALGAGGVIGSGAQSRRVERKGATGAS